MNKRTNNTAPPRKPVAELSAIDLTAHEHEHSELVISAAQWHADQNPAPAPAIPALCQRFNLTALEACEALAMARRFRIVRRAHG